MLDIYGTIGPACADVNILKAMFQEGMTGIRLNTSHVSLREAEDQVSMIHEAAASAGVKAKILIDLQGPELRIGKMQPVCLQEDDQVFFSVSEFIRDIYDKDPVIPVNDMVFRALVPEIQVLLDDGKLLLSITEDTPEYKIAVVIRGGLLRGGKSIALKGTILNPPALTAQDIQNLSDAKKYGITGVMQPFVRSKDDLKQVRECMNQFGGEEIRLLAKIENLSGVANLEDFFEIADEIVIARGDLGNAVPLWDLPKLQKEIEARCRRANMPFMVVTQMLSSMEHSAVPTRAEVSDIYNAVCDGASSVMVTGETAVGEYPVEVIRYLMKTAYA